MEKTTIPFVITEDIRSITRRLPFVVSEQMTHHVSTQIVKICKRFITPIVLLLEESSMTEWIARVTPPNAIIQTLAYTDFLTTCYPELQITRATTWEKSTAVQVSRYGYPSLETQLLSIKEGEYVLVDDVIFSGEGCCDVVIKGRNMGRNITKVICCVSIGTGKKKLDDLGIQTQSLYHFENVIDEVCLRDFIPGLPFSGRPFIQNPAHFLGKHKFVPYLLPWGDPHERISVPKNNEVQFSIDCLELAIEFWSEVAPKMTLANTPAPIYDLSVDENMFLWRYLHQCKQTLVESSG